jgi:Holliday junction DNA helicase RuvA
MYNFVKGKIVEKQNNILVLENNGIGYELIASTNTISNLPQLNTETKVYTYQQVREDGIFLYAFSSLEEKSMFLHLISISGIGPKMAIGILSNISLYDLALAIISENADVLYSIKGIGKKTAERIVLELKEKLEDINKFDKSSNLNKEFDDAIIALTTLGVSKIDAVKKVRELAKADESAEQIISKVLKSMS